MDINARGTAMERDRLLEHLVRVGRPVITTLYTEPNSCILSTQVVLGVCAIFGIPGLRLSVSAVVHAPAVPGWEVLATEPASKLLTWARERGADTGGIGGSGGEVPGNNLWRGHLVAFVADSELVDLSLEQANRGRIRLRPWRVSVDTYDQGDFVRFLQGEQGLPVAVDDAAVMYYAQPEDNALDRGWASHLVTASMIVRVIGGEIVGLDRIDDRFPQLYETLSRYPKP